MNPFQKFKKALLQHGLEYFGLYYGVYRGSVVDNKDPDFLGRVKIKVPTIYGESIPKKWVYPRGVGMPGKGHGSFFVPSIGDPIYVTFENGDPKFPLYETGWWLKGQVPESAKVENQNVFLIQSPDGRRIEINDHEGKILIEDKSGMKIIADSNGVFIGKNNTNNLGKFLDELFDIFSRTTSGPYPFNNVSEYIAQGEKIKSFLKSSE